MRVELRIPANLTTRMRADLVRPNPFGGERVGFMATRSVKAGDTLVVLTLPLASGAAVGRLTT